MRARQERSTMSLHHWPRSTPKHTPVRPRSTQKHAHVRAAAKPLASGIGNDENSREFAEFIESISATPEELAAIVSTPELSIPEIKQQLRDGKTGRPQANRSGSGSAETVLVKIRPPGVRSIHS